MLLLLNIFVSGFLFSETRDFFVFSANSKDPRLPVQQELLEREADGVKERDIRLIQIIGDEVKGGQGSAQELRNTHKVEPNAFQIILIGKDGTEKYRSAHPMSMQKLFSLIDSMPMRKRETKERQNSSP